ncbi:MAG: VOC family protein [Candidatus Binataceae bacterium]
MGAEITGIDHVYLTVSDLARSEVFYDRVMEALGFYKGDAPIGGEPHCHYYCPEFQITIRPAKAGTDRHDPYAPGLHHLCMRAPDNAAVDEAARILCALGVEIDGPRHCPEYAPDYYAMFFSDPDGIRLEVMNHIERRKTIRARWTELAGFLNPLHRLLTK